MKNTYILVSLIVVVALSTLGYLYLEKGTLEQREQETKPTSDVVTAELPGEAIDEPTITTPAETTSTPTETTPDTPAPTPAVTGITMATVAQHNSKTSCWTAINGTVYDLTPFISKHPGGSSAILSLCGVDGTTDFMNQHGGERKPEAILASYKIDVVAR